MNEGLHSLSSPFGGVRLMLCQRSSRLLALLVALMAALPAAGADRLILRNLDIITDRTVTAFDEDGIILDAALPSGRNKLTWDEIERGKVALDQPRFDSFLGELGLPLYRIRQRLRLGDIRGAGEVADTLYSRFGERRSQTAYMIHQAVMWSRLAAGHPEEAADPALRCYELLKTRAATLAEHPGTRRPKFDVDTGLSSELPPLWLDPVAAKKALPDVERAIRWMSQPRPPAAYLYYATFAIAAGDAAEAERVAPSLSTGSSPALADLIKAEQELTSHSPGPALERLRVSRGSLPEACRPVASYLLGLLDSQSDDADRCRDGLLELLSIPAEHGQELRELSAAALYYAATGLDQLKDATGAAAVRTELTSRYGTARFAVATQGQ